MRHDKMFVMSDIFDLEQITQKRWIWNWRERLVGGIAFHGTDYPGAEAAARFVVAATEVCGLQGQLPVAGYKVRWDQLSEHVEPSAIWDLAKGALPGASEAECVYLEGSQGSVNTHDRVKYGGGVDAVPRLDADNKVVTDYPYRTFDGDFAFPLDGEGLERAEALLRLASEILGADYGYYFVRDAFADPEFYLRGQGGPVDRSRLARADAAEARQWNEFVRNGELWTGAWPQLRDIFAVNLLTERHLSADFEAIGYLDQWITTEPGRGSLTEVGHGRFLWSLTDAEIYAVRPALWDLGLMCSCMPRVYRDLPYARQRPDPETCKVP
jgi:hypothetical protein